MTKCFAPTFLVFAIASLTFADDPASDTKSRLRAAATALGQGDDKTALSVLDTATRIAPNDPVAFLMRGTVHQHTGNERLAIDDFTRSIALGDKTGLAHLGRATSRLTLGDTKAAFDDATQGLEINPKMAMAHMLHGRVYHEQELYADAIAAFNIAISIEPIADAYLYRSLCHLRLNDYPSAHSDASNAAKLAPTNPAPLFVRAAASGKLGDTDAAVADYQTAKRLESPGH